MSIQRLILVLFFFLSAKNVTRAQCPAATPLTISNIAVNESRCQASGTASVTLTGGTAPYSYQIIAGPVLQPEQSNATFESLSPGIYTMRVKDACNTTLTENFTIAGNYQVPQVTITPKSPTCPNGNDGSITIGVTKGRAPFLYSLIAPSPVTVAPQASNVFTGLTSGEYTCRITDSCGNFQTRTLTIAASNVGEFYFGAPELIWQACDSFKLAYLMWPNNYLEFKAPYTVTLSLPDGRTLLHTVSPDINNNLTDTFAFSYHHISGTSPTLLLQATNACGYTTQYGTPTYQLNMYPLEFLPTECSPSYSYRLDEGDNDPNYYPYKFHCSNITYTLKDETGTVLATQVNKSSFSGYPANKWYTVVRKDCCMTDSTDFFWHEVTPFKIAGYELRPAHVYKEGTTALEVYFNKVASVDVILASGPPSITFADGTTQQYSYPDTVKNGGPFFNAFVSYLTTGTYKVIVVNSCGQRDSIDVTVQPQHLRHSDFTTSLIKGCVGANKILLNAVTNQNGTFETGKYYVNGNPVYGNSITTATYNDSLINLSAGNYYFQYHYTTAFGMSYLKGMLNLPADIIYDTVIIPPYTQPQFAANAAIATCGSNRSVALLPDSTRGVTPYSFQITAGQVTRPPQASAVFNNLPQGTYTFLQADGCGNSYSANISIDSFAVPPVMLTGSSCSGAAAQLSLPNIPYYTYIWQRPNGSTAAGNLLSFNPVTNADTGWYQIASTSTVGTCVETKQSNYRLDLCVTLPLHLLQFHATVKENATLINWRTADEVNISHFELQKSSNGIEYITWKIQIAAGQALNNYGARDAAPFDGKSFYRIKMIGNDGEMSYSNIQTVVHHATGEIKALPSLIVTEAATVIRHPKAAHGAVIRLFSMDGKMLQQKPVASGAVHTSLSTGQLPSGVYTCVFTNAGITLKTRMVKK